ncbi:MAG: hypothetical protein ACREA9_28960 [Pyrinomonadaceae bacterium]
MIYRDPDTGKYLTEKEWQALQDEQEFFEDDFEDFDSFDEEEYGEET